MYCQKLNVVAFLAIILVSCAKEEKRTDIVTFPLKGEVVEIDTARNRLMVAHEEIPNYMMAMTMPFKVKNRALLYDLRVGDTITATLAVSRTESWLETITVVGKGEEPDPQLVAGAIMARMLKPGDMLPDDSYINQDGRRIRLSDFKGKAVALTFIYTRCPLPDYCILMSNNFGKVQRLLAQDRSLDGKWHLITVSFDPKFDSPRVLKEYGKSYRADFASWDFITDPDTSGKTIMKLADGLGLTYENDEGGLIAHNLRTVILDKEGRIRKVIQGNEWKAEEVAEELRKLAR
jgi:protein SCO1/2